MKRCSRCGETKSRSDFSISNNSHDGLHTYCKPCAATHRREARVMLKEGKKFCKRCGETKPLEEFYGKRTGGERYQAWCKECQKKAVISGYRENPEKHAAYNREWGRKNPDSKADIALKTRLGLPHGTYARMLTEQVGKCGICGTENPGARLRRFHVDHDNTTGLIRGLLCENCNRGIGALQHSKVILTAAIHYLESSELTGSSGRRLDNCTEELV